MICPNCGSNNKEDSKFCANCGKEIPLEGKDTTSNKYKHDIITLK